MNGTLDLGTKTKLLIRENYSQISEFAKNGQLQLAVEPITDMDCMI